MREHFKEFDSIGCNVLDLFFVLVSSDNHPIFKKINRVYLTVTCNIHTKFELNRKHNLDAIVFTDTHTP